MDGGSGSSRSLGKSPLRARKMRRRAAPPVGHPDLRRRGRSCFLDSAIHRRCAGMLNSLPANQFTNQTIRQTLL
jgi:hypothetical protein